MSNEDFSMIFFILMESFDKGIPEYEHNEPKPGEILYEVLDKMRDRKNVDASRQNDQLDALLLTPETFFDDMKGFIEYLRHVRGVSDEDLPGYVDGEIFEQLVRNERKICPEPETPAGSALRAVMNDPYKYDAEEWVPEPIRNPDGSHINKFNEIDIVTEAKMTQVGIRFRKQTLGFRPNFVHMIKTLKGVHSAELREHGLGAIADKKNYLSVAPDFKIHLVFSFGVFDKDDLNSVIQENLSPYEKQEIRTAIGTCVVFESSFSAKEIRTLRNFVLDKYAKDVNIQEANDEIGPEMEKFSLGVAVGPKAALPVT